jgi:hypothetical protein
MLDSDFTLYFYRSQLIALKTSDGSVLYESEPMAGVAKGTPVATSDGSLLITTHNVGGSTGYFTVFQYGVATPNFTYTETAPFSAVGHFWNPIEGNYLEGAGNPNDIFIWALDTPEGTTEVGEGSTYRIHLWLVLVLLLQTKL